MRSKGKNDSAVNKGRVKHDRVAKWKSIRRNKLCRTVVMNTAQVMPRKPPKFSWVVPGLLAAHGRPTKHGNIEYLTENGIRTLITLTENKPRALAEYPGNGLRWVHIPVKDEKPPEVTLVEEFVRVVKSAKMNKEMVSVHCAWGRGRTGTMCACYLLHQGNLSPEQAIAQIRELRPGSIDTTQQESVVTKYYESIKQ